MKNSLKDRYIGLLEIGNKKIRKKKKKKGEDPHTTICILCYNIRYRCQSLETGTRKETCNMR